VACWETAGACLPCAAASARECRPASGPAWMYSASCVAPPGGCRHGPPGSRAGYETRISYEPEICETDGWANIGSGGCGDRSSRAGTLRSTAVVPGSNRSMALVTAESVHAGQTVDSPRGWVEDLRTDSCSARSGAVEKRCSPRAGLRARRSGPHAQHAAEAPRRGPAPASAGAGRRGHPHDMQCTLDPARSRERRAVLPGTARLAAESMWNDHPASAHVRVRSRAGNLLWRSDPSGRW